MHFVSCSAEASKGIVAKALRRPPPPTFVRAQNAACEFRDRMERRLRRFAMRRMPGARNDRHLDRAVALFLGDLGLTDGAVLIVGALQDRDGDPDVGEVFGYVPTAKLWIEPRAVPAIERIVDIAVPARQFRLEVGRLVGLLDLGDRGHRNIFHDEMRRDHCDPAYAVILNSTGVDRGDRSAVGMSDQEAAAKACRVQQLRQDVERFGVHVVERARQLDRRRGAIARARVHEHAGAGGGGKPVRKIPPQPGRSQPFMQHDDGRRVSRRRTDHAVFKIGSADAEEAGGIETLHDIRFPKEITTLHSHACRPGERRDPYSAASLMGRMADTFLNNEGRWLRVPAFAGTTRGGDQVSFYPAPSRNLNRWIFPVAVLGRLSTTSIQRGYFHGPIFCLTCSFSASCRPSVLASARSTTNAFGFSNPSGSASGTTAASSTAGWVISALSTANGATQMPDTLNMSSLRPQKV